MNIITVTVVTEPCNPDEYLITFSARFIKFSLEQIFFKPEYIQKQAAINLICAVFLPYHNTFMLSFDRHFSILIGLIFFSLKIALCLQQNYKMLIIKKYGTQ